MKQRFVSHVRFYFNYAANLEKELNNEQMGRLFFAVARYGETGVTEDVGDDIQQTYINYCRWFDGIMELRGLERRVD